MEIDGQIIYWAASISINEYESVLFFFNFYFKAHNIILKVLRRDQTTRYSIEKEWFVGDKKGNKNSRM